MAEAPVFRVGVLHRLPAIDAPMQGEGRLQ